MRGHMPMIVKNAKKCILAPFWPLFRPKLVKMTQNYFFLASDAKLFPTRGHMPMLEKNAKKCIFAPFWALFRPKLVKMVKIIPFQSRLNGNN